MEDQREREPKSQKKPYIKPEVKRVQLKPEEAVLGSCKTTGFSGPASSGNCNPLGSNCHVQGS